MSRHSFDPEIAKQVGVNAAVIYQNIYWWCEKNAANGKHLHDGRFWTYNSVSAFDDLFPYLTRKQIRGALDKLLDAGLLVSGNYNEIAYDRTKWYSPTCPLAQAELPDKASSFAQKGQPIPDSKPDHKPDVRKRAQAIPDDWMPTAFKHGTKSASILSDWSPEEYAMHLEHFMQHHRSKGTTFVSWQDAWGTWVINSDKFKGKTNGNGHRTSGTDRRSSLARAIDEGIDFLG